MFANKVQDLEALKALRRCSDVGEGGCPITQTRGTSELERIKIPAQQKTFPSRGRVLFLSIEDGVRGSRDLVYCPTDLAQARRSLFSQPLQLLF